MDTPQTPPAPPAANDLGDRYGSGGYTATITVRARCTCGASRWFLCSYSCPGRDVLDVFEGEGYAEAPAAPLPYFVAQIRAIYHTADLIYLD